MLEAIVTGRPGKTPRAPIVLVLLVIGGLVLGCNSRGASEAAPAPSSLAASRAPEAGTGSAGDLPAGVKLVPGKDPCATVCERSKQLGCSGTPSCAEHCAASRDIEVCRTEMRTVLECIVAKPVESWECGEEGLAAIKSGVCDAEQATFMGCLARKGR